jgi:hypothetical protein
MQPFKCPVCLGTGKVPVDFYSGLPTTDCNPQPCRSCHGSGIVWPPTAPVSPPLQYPPMGSGSIGSAKCSVCGGTLGACPHSFVWQTRNFDRSCAECGGPIWQCRGSHTYCAT